MKIIFCLALFSFSYLSVACNVDTDCDTVIGQYCYIPPATCTGCTPRSVVVTVVPEFNRIPFSHSFSARSYGSNDCGCTRVNVPGGNFQIDSLIFRGTFAGNNFEISQVPSTAITRGFNYSEPRYSSPSGECRDP